MVDGLYANQPFEEFFTAFVGSQPVPIYLIIRGEESFIQLCCLDARVEPDGDTFCMRLIFGDEVVRFSSNGVEAEEEN